MTSLAWYPSGIMKTFLLTTLLLAGTCAWCAKPEVIPELRQWTDASEGGTFVLTDKTHIVIPKEACAELTAGAETFAKELGVPLVRDGKWQQLSTLATRANTIALTVVPDAEANPESYTLTVTPKCVTVTSPTPQGAFWGTRSLLQVFRAKQGAFPCGTAKDWPDYSVRGFMFDCGRKPFTLTTLRQIVDICAYYKLNDLQLHLSDNYIWLHKYPGVQTAEDVLKIEPSAGAFRLESKVPGLTSTDIAYTKADYQALERYATARGVNLIPEIDVPGHALALVRVRPDLMYHGSVGKKHTCERAAMLDLTKPETFPFVASIFDEYINDGVFSGDVVHIGTDEYYGDSESYRAFADRMLKHIRAKGKTPRLWGSLTAKSGKTDVTADGVQMNIWSLSWQNPKDALAAGYDIINILDTYTYVVPNGRNNIGPYADDIDTKHLYESWSPAAFRQFQIDPKEPKLIGGAWALWNDNSFMTDPGLIGRDLLARIRRNCAVVAEKTWDREPLTRSYAQFMRTLEENGTPVCVARPNWERTYCVTRTDDAPLKLAEGDETDLWAVSPVNGNVGFRSEGAQYTFNYALPKGEPVSLRFQATPNNVELWVNGRPVAGKPKRQFYPDTFLFYSLAAPERDVQK